MATQEMVRARTYGSSAAIPQFRFVTSSTTTGLVATTAAGLYAVGVSLGTTTASGQTLPVAYDGRLQVEAGGPITVGAILAAGNSGRAVVATVGQVIMGQAVEAAVFGQLMTVEFRRDGTLA